MPSVAEGRHTVSKAVMIETFEGFPYVPPQPSLPSISVHDWRVPSPMTHHHAAAGTSVVWTMNEYFEGASVLFLILAMNVGVVMSHQLRKTLLLKSVEDMILCYGFFAFLCLLCYYCSGSQEFFFHVFISLYMCFVKLLFDEFTLLGLVW